MLKLAGITYYGMAEKLPLIDQDSNPCIDPAGFQFAIALNEKAMRLRLEEQRDAATR